MQRLIALTAQAPGTVNGVDQSNTRGCPARGLHLSIDITANPGATATLTVHIEGKDRVTNKYYPILSSAALSAVAHTQMRVFPGAAVTANVSANDGLPPDWRVRAVVGGAGSITATVAAGLLA